MLKLQILSTHLPNVLHLQKHFHWNFVADNFKYSSVVGMMYLASHSRPDISYAVNCATSYIAHSLCIDKPFTNWSFSEAAADKELMTKLYQKLLKIDSFPDANIAGIYGQKAMDVPVCVMSRTDYMMIVLNGPISV